MKKITLITVAIILILVSTINVFAEVKFNDFINDGKIDYELEKVLSDSYATDSVAVAIQFKVSKGLSDMNSWPDIEKANIEYNEYLNTLQSEHISKMSNIYIDRVINNNNRGIFSIITKCSEIEKIVLFDFVNYVTYIDIQNISEINYICYSNFIDMLYRSTNTYLYKYKELYCHYNNDSVDWILLEAPTSDWSSNAYASGVIFQRYFSNYICIDYPFTYGLGVYDVKQNQFFDICDIYNTNQYIGLEDAINTLDNKSLFYCKSYLLGDLNNDNKISVLDVTIIQQSLTGLRDFPDFDKRYYDGFESITIGKQITYISDYNEDGNRNILDATAIQKSIAKLG